MSKNNHGYVIVKYKDNVTTMSTSSISYGNLGKLVGKITSDYRYDIGEHLIRNDRKIVIIDRERRKRKGTKTRVWKWYQIKCLNCKNTHWIVESQLRHGSGCPFCIDYPAKLVVGFNDVATVAPWMIPFFQGGIEEARKFTAHSSTAKIYPKCPICGKVSKRKMKIGGIYQRHSIGCGCNTYMSFPEQTIYNLLEQHNIDFIHQLTRTCNGFEWTGSKRYDFYIPSLSCIIETHGLQHYEKTFSKNKTVKEQQKKDREKRILAKNNNIQNYFEIDCRKSDIDWILDSCEKEGLLNFLNIDRKEIDINCLYKSVFKKDIERCKKVISKYPYISATELSSLLNIHQNKIYQILKLICFKPVYRGTVIDVYKDGKYVMTCYSYANLKDVFMDKYNIKMGIVISKYLDNNKPYHGCFTFRTNKEKFGGEKVC